MPRVRSIIYLIVITLPLVWLATASQAQFGGGIPAKTHGRVVAICVTNTRGKESTFRSGFIGPVDGAIVMESGDLYVHIAKFDDAIKAYSKAAEAIGQENSDINLQQIRLDMVGRIGLSYLFSGCKALALQQYQQLVDLAKNNSKLGKCAGEEASVLKDALDRPEFR